MSIEIFKIDTLDDLRAYAKKVTAEHRGDGGATAGAAKVEESELSRSFKSIWSKADFGDASKAVGMTFGAILKAITKEDVDFNKIKSRDSDSDSDNGDIKKFDVVVVTGHSNDNNYPIGQPTIIFDEDEGYGLMFESAEDGNHIGKQWRYATDAEVDALFDSWKDSEADASEILDWF